LISSNLALIDFPNLSISLLQKPTTELIQGEGVSIFHRQDRGKPVEQKSLPLAPLPHFLLHPQPNKDDAQPAKQPETTPTNQAFIPILSSHQISTNKSLQASIPTVNL
jgi:hypothetical protein